MKTEIVASTTIIITQGMIILITMTATLTQATIIIRQVKVYLMKNLMITTGDENV